jgi:hypothetical protein
MMCLQPAVVMMDDQPPDVVTNVNSTVLPVALPAIRPVLLVLLLDLAVAAALIALRSSTPCDATGQEVNLGHRRLSRDSGPGSPFSPPP